MIFGARDVNLSHLYPVRVSYAPKGIVTEAIQATRENIGKLALEFEEELLFNHEDAPYFRIQAERGTQSKPQTPRLFHIRPGDWIVPLRDEIHVYKDELFQNTFDIETLISPDFQEGIQTPEQVRDSLRGVVSETYDARGDFNPRPGPLPDDDPVFDAGLDGGYAPDNRRSAEGYPTSSGDVVGSSENSAWRLAADGQ
jgi:hypothetical protein